eukprot:CAMPEP_0114175188 /NCGR_PEP_ID=MMETSP0043_2-20121206/36824_1 /TAXON_ID=464988 /ORGANISM="Hemiselmis andersenii, Strain CCMP644" /LENGTH=42 /DNA_ID= /DNA_START= /DNA_END= /DNA_ORIENTATION=
MGPTLLYWLQGRDNPSMCALVSDFSTGDSFGTMQCQHQTVHV